MIPLKLTMKGFYSYREETVIDFTPLTAAGLFGIFGRVGSGKSSIPDAIGFALYGKSERLNASEKRHYMHVSAGELLVEFDFRHLDAVYRFRVSGKRPGRGEAAPRYSRSSYRLEAGEWLPLSDGRDGEERDASEILDLSYDNFRRAVVIPQGAFQDFLRLSGKERTDMLQELFRLERFDLFAPVSRLLAGTRARIEGAAERERTLEEQDEGSPAELGERIAALETEEAGAAAALERLRLETALLAEARERQERLSALTEEKRALDEEAPAWEERRGALERYEKILREVKPCYDDLRREEQRTGSLSALLKEAVEALDAGGRELERCSEEFSRCEEAASRREELEAEARSLVRLQELFRLEKDVSALNRELLRSAEQEAVLAASAEGLRRERALTAERAVALEEASAADQELPEAGAWFTADEALRRELGTASGEAGRLAEEASGLLESIESAVSGLPARAASAEELRALLETLEAERRKAMAEQSLASFRSMLVPGEPCPLCGSPDHPAPVEFPGEHGDETAGRAIEAVNGALKIVVPAESRRALLLEQLERKRRTIAELEEAVSEHRTQFRWKELSPDGRERWEALTAEASARREELKELRRRAGVLDDELRGLEERLAGIREARTEMEKTAAGLSARVSLLGEDLPRGLREMWADRNPGAIAERTRCIEEETRGVRERLEAASRRKEELSGRIGALKGTVQERSRLLDESERAAAENRERLGPLMHRFGFEDEREVEAFFARPFDAEGERESIEARDRKLHLLNEQIAGLRSETGGQPYDPVLHRQLESELEQKKHRQKELWQELATLRERLEKAREREKELLRLRKELKALEGRREGLNLLLSMMKGSGFVRFVSVRYLRELCARANERFLTLTGKSMALEVDDSGDFLVRDYLNGGQLRSVKTLSGGQTFQASFCLAVALSESVRKERDSFFFLDEGFGSLDRDSLSLVFETLKGLRRERSIVGVISHVEALQEEIDTSLTVRKDPSRGSVISYASER